MHVVCRPGHEGDMRYVLGSWVSATKKEHRHTPWAIHNEHLNRRIMALLRRGARVLIASDPEASNLIFGWTCYETFDDEARITPTAVHWLNVKRPYRRLGLARMMLEHIGIDLEAPIIASDCSYIAHVVGDRYPITVVPQLLDGLDLI